MKALTQQDLIPHDEYERRRETYRQAIIELKRRRRIGLGEKMIRVERIFDPQKVQEELDVYNALLPASGELSATLLIELTDPDTMKQWLDLFMGLDHGQKVGLRAGGDVVYGEFEGGHSHDTKISAVHFVRFRPTPAMVTAIGDQAARAEAEVPWVMRQEWLEDLSTVG